MAEVYRAGDERVRGQHSTQDGGSRSLGGGQFFGNLSPTFLRAT